jgi:hypothetical protein
LFLGNGGTSRSVAANVVNGAFAIKRRHHGKPPARW